jgi:hypothetical protein
MKSTYDRFIASLTPQERKEFDNEYKELAFSEMLLAIMQKDEISAKRLAREAGIPLGLKRNLR